MKRITFNFICGIQGWSEIHYAAEIPTASQLLLVATQRLLNLNQSGFMVDCRASDMDGSKDVTTGLLSCSPQNPWPGVWGLPAGSDPAFVSSPHDFRSSVLFTVKCGVTRSLPMTIRGFADHVITNNAVDPTNVADVVNNMNLYLAALKAAGMGFRSKSGTANRAEIVSFGTQTLADPLVNFSFTGGPILKDDEIQLQSVKPFNHLNGYYRVSYIGEDGNAFLRGTSKVRALGVVEEGFTTKNTFTVLTPDTATIKRVTSRKIGLPFDVQRGRR